MWLGLIVGAAVTVGAQEDDSRHRQFAIAMWRHGARSPMEFQPAFNDTLQVWPQGAGQLTPVGRDMHRGNFK